MRYVVPSTPYKHASGVVARALVFKLLADNSVNKIWCTTSNPNLKPTEVVSSTRGLSTQAALQDAGPGRVEHRSLSLIFLGSALNRCTVLFYYRVYSDWNVDC